MDKFDMERAEMYREFENHRRDEMIEALAPFAKIADFYDGFEDDIPVLVVGGNDGPARITVGDLRAAREAMID